MSSIVRQERHGARDIPGLPRDQEAIVGARFGLTGISSARWASMATKVSFRSTSRVRAQSHNTNNFTRNSSSSSDTPQLAAAKFILIDLSSSSNVRVEDEEVQAARAIIRETSGSMAGLERATLIMLAEDEEYYRY